MKYLSTDMSPEEAKRKYRTLAKTMHPDVGGDEEEFKILAKEYTELQCERVALEIPDINDMFSAAGTLVNEIASTVAELYPRTSVVLNYGVNDIDAYFQGNVSMKRMLEVAGVIRSFQYDFDLTMYFQRSPLKKWIPLWTRGDTVYINVSREETPSLDALATAYSGRRYVITANKKYEVCQDLKEGKWYIMHRTTKLRLQTILGIGA